MWAGFDPDSPDMSASSVEEDFARLDELVGVWVKASDGRLFPRSRVDRYGEEHFFEESDTSDDDSGPLPDIEGWEVEQVRQQGLRMVGDVRTAPRMIN